MLITKFSGVKNDTEIDLVSRHFSRCDNYHVTVKAEYSDQIGGYYAVYGLYHDDEMIEQKGITHSSITSTKQFVNAHRELSILGEWIAAP